MGMLIQWSKVQVTIEKVLSLIDWGIYKGFSSTEKSKIDTDGSAAAGKQMQRIGSIYKDWSMYVLGWAGGNT